MLRMNPAGTGRRQSSLAKSRAVSSQQKYAKRKKLSARLGDIESCSSSDLIDDSETHSEGEHSVAELEGSAVESEISASGGEEGTCEEEEDVEEEEELSNELESETGQGDDVDDANRGREEDEGSVASDQDVVDDEQAQEVADECSDESSDGAEEVKDKKKVVVCGVNSKIPLRDFRMLYAGNRHKLTREITTALLKIFRKMGAPFPSCPKTLELDPIPGGPTTYSRIPKELNDTEATVRCGLNRYAHFGLERVLTHALRNLSKCDLRDDDGAVVDKLQLWLSIDGVTKFKNSEFAGEFWPIVLSVGNVAILKRKLYLVGVYYGTKNAITKSSAFANELLEETEKEYAALKGMPWRLVGDGTIDIELCRIVADAPARAMLRGTVGHAGKEPCDRCKVRGTKPGTRVRLPVTGLDDVALRTDNDFRNPVNSNHHRFKNRCTCVFRSFPELDLIALFILDAMHLVYIGVFKRWWEWVFPRKGEKVPTANVVHKTTLAQLSNKYVSWRNYSPCDFARSPRQMLKEKWKATEWRQLLLYTGVPLLKECDVKDKYVVNLQYLMCAMRILSDPELCIVDSNLSIADDCIKKFVGYAVDLLTEEFAVYNVHVMLHMVDDVRACKRPLDELTAFAPENFFGKLMKCVRAANKPLQQLVNCVEQSVAWEADEFPGGAKQEAAKHAKKVAFQFTNQCKEDHSRFHCCETRDGLLFDARRERDRYCVLQLGRDILNVKITMFVEEVGDALSKQQFVEGYVLKLDKREFFEQPLKASRLGIHWDRGTEFVKRRDGTVDKSKKVWPVDSIKRKLYRLPVKNQHVIIPIIHTNTKW